MGLRPTHRLRRRASRVDEVMGVEEDDAPAGDRPLGRAEALGAGLLVLVDAGGSEFAPILTFETGRRPHGDRSFRASRKPLLYLASEWRGRNAEKIVLLERHH